MSKQRTLLLGVAALSSDGGIAAVLGVWWLSPACGQPAARSCCPQHAHLALPATERSLHESRQAEGNGSLF